MSILDQIVSHKLAEVEAERQKVPENELRALAQKTGQDRRPFTARLARPGVNIIAEIKRASPSKGVICAGLDAAKTAMAYEEGGAAALSVLTDAHFFKGAAADLQTARKSTRLPVLRKDFIVSAYQIYESKVMGADAVLLIVRILELAQLKDYLALSAELSLDALVEIHSPADLDRATSAGASLIGINNRDLGSFATSIQVTLGIKPLLAPAQIAVAASGIAGPEEIRALSKAGIHNFLIGESLVRAADPAAFLRRLRAAGEPS